MGEEHGKAQRHIVAMLLARGPARLLFCAFSLRPPPRRLPLAANPFLRVTSHDPFIIGL